MINRSMTELLLHALPVLQIFTRVLRSLNLPVGSSQLHVGRNGNSYDIGVAVVWIVAMMVSDWLVDSGDEIGERRIPFP